MSQLNSGTILLAFVAVLCGLGGTYALRLHFRQPPAVEQAPPPPPVKPALITIPLASRDIPAGTQITLDDVALYKMTREDITEKITPNSFMADPKQIVGKYLKNDLKKSRPFNTQDFYPGGQSPGIAGRLKPGLRAVTIMLEPTNALRGFAGPGQNVDVLFHYGGMGGESAADHIQNGTAANQPNSGFYPNHHDFNPPRHRDYYGNTIGGAPGGGSGNLPEGFESATATLVQDAEILALGRHSMPTDSASGLPDDQRVAVTLAVRPRDAELLRVADGHGELSLTLRGPHDEELVQLVDPVTLAQIIDVKNSIHETEVYRGKNVSRLKFAGGTIIQRRIFNAPESSDSNTPDSHASNAGDNSQHPSPVPNPGQQQIQPPTFVPVWSIPPGYYPNQYDRPPQPALQPAAETTNRDARPVQVSQ